MLLNELLFKIRFNKKQKVTEAMRELKLKREENNDLQSNLKVIMIKSYIRSNFFQIRFSHISRNEILMKENKLLQALE